MRILKFIICLFTLYFKSFGQTGLNSIIPYDHFKLDTPVTFKHSNDFQILEFYDNDSIDKKIIFSAKVNSLGKKVFTVSTGYSGLEGKKTFKYDQYGNLVETTFYPMQDKSWGIEKSFFYYDKRNRLIKFEKFNFGERRTFKTTVDTAKLFQSTTPNQIILEYDDSLYNIFYSWNQSYLDSFSYDLKNRLIEENQFDEFNQRIQTIYQYDKKGRKIKKLKHRFYFYDYKDQVGTYDSIVGIYDYTYLKNGVIIKKQDWELWDCIFSIDTFFTNKHGNITKHEFAWKQIHDESKAISSNEFYNTPFENFGCATFEYDLLNRKTKAVRFNDKFSSTFETQLYNYKNSSIPEINESMFKQE